MTITKVSETAEITQKIYLNLSQSSNPWTFSYNFHPVLNSVNPQGAKSPQVMICKNLLCMNSVEHVCSESCLHPLDICATEMKVISDDYI